MGFERDPHPQGSWNGWESSETHHQNLTERLRGRQQGSCPLLCRTTHEKLLRSRKIHCRWFVVGDFEDLDRPGKRVHCLNCAWTVRTCLPSQGMVNDDWGHCSRSECSENLQEWTTPGPFRSLWSSNMATEHKHPFAGISCCHVWFCHISQGTSCRWPLRLSIRHNPSLDTSEKREWSLQPRFNRRKPTLCCGRCICMSANVLKFQLCLIKNNNQHFCNILTIPQYGCMFSVATRPRLDPQMVWKMLWDICNSWVVVQKMTRQLVCKGWFTV